MIERYATLTQTLLQIRGDLDRELREHGKTSSALVEQAHEQAATARRSLASNRHRFEQLISRAAAAGLPTDGSDAVPANFDGEPSALFAQMIDRLEQALSEAEHTQTALAAERDRQRRRRAELEQERKRQAAAEQERLERARNHDRLLAILGLATICASILAGFALDSAAGLLAPAIGALLLGYATTAKTSTLAPRLGKPWATNPALAHGTGRTVWVACTAASILFCLYALASLAAGPSPATTAAGLALTLICGAFTVVAFRRSH